MVEDPEIAFWWASPVEISSGLFRRFREGSLNSLDLSEARRSLKLLLEEGIEIAPGTAVRENAVQLLRLHSLRAADALQLAAALSISGMTSGVDFVCLDQRLRDAALAEGLRVLP